MHGAGNDFVLIDNREEARENGTEIINKNEIIRLCDRRKGIGADGILILVPSEQGAFGVKFFNSDGSPGSLCGNGARCIINYAQLKGVFSKGALEFKFGDKLYTGSIESDGNPRFNIPRPAKLKKNFRIKAGGALLKANYCDNGSPHVVIEIGDVPVDPQKSPVGYQEIEHFPVHRLGSEIRHHIDFAPDGVNVNFVKVISENEVEIRTFERGVEGETLACGTGAAATAVVLFALGKTGTKLKLLTRSGDYLTVDLEIINNKLENIGLTGPAEIAFHGTVGLD